MGRPILADDAETPTLSAAELAEDDAAREAVAADDAGTSLEGDDDGNDDADGIVAEGAQEQLDDFEYDPKLLALIAGEQEKRDGMVPQWRVDQIVAERELARREAHDLREANKGKTAEAAPKAVARDYDAEIETAFAKYTDGSLTPVEYQKQLAKIAREQAKEELRAENAAELESLRADNAASKRREFDAQFNAEVEKWQRKYPFLDQNSEHYDKEATDAVNAEHVILMKRDGLSAIRALNLAVRSIAPEFLDRAPVAEEEGDEEETAEEKVERIRAERAALARKSGAAAVAQMPPPARRLGVGNRITAGKIPLTRSVVDHEKWEKASADQKKLFVPV